MQLQPEDARPHEPRRRLLPAALLLLGLFGWCGEAHASSSTSSWDVGAEAHSRDCKCGSQCRGASCCCGHRSAPALPAPRPPDAPSSGGLELDASPCLGAAPCGESGLPTGSAGSHVGKAATLAMDGPPGPEGLRGFLTTSPCRVLPARRASRLDDPPEGLPLA